MNVGCSYTVEPRYIELHWTVRKSYNISEYQIDLTHMWCAAIVVHGAVTFSEGHVYSTATTLHVTQCITIVTTTRSLLLDYM